MSWTEVCPLSDLPPGSREVVEIDDVFIAVFNVAGQLYAIENICTHDGAPLTGGCVENDVIICPRARRSLGLTKIKGPDTFSRRTFRSFSNRLRPEAVHQYLPLCRIG
jgi:3-phenylpropionate/trans-cinnamate dioxygenase ferredoxin subunit